MTDDESVETGVQHEPTPTTSNVTVRRHLDDGVISVIGTDSVTGVTVTMSSVKRENCSIKLSQYGWYVPDNYLVGDMKDLIELVNNLKSYVTCHLSRMDILGLFPSIIRSLEEKIKVVRTCDKVINGTRDLRLRAGKLIGRLSQLLQYICDDLQDAERVLCHPDLHNVYRETVYVVTCKMKVVRDSVNQEPRDVEPCQVHFRQLAKAAGKPAKEIPTSDSISVTHSFDDGITSVTGTDVASGTTVRMWCIMSEKYATKLSQYGWYLRDNYEVEDMKEIIDFIDNLRSYVNCDSPRDEILGLFPCLIRSVECLIGLDSEGVECDNIIDQNQEERQRATELIDRLVVLLHYICYDLRHEETVLKHSDLHNVYGEIVYVVTRKLTY